MKNYDLSACQAAIDKASSKIMAFVNQIVDGESFVETDVFLTGKGFDSALDALGEGVVTGYATIGGMPVHLFAQNAEVLKGSLSKAHAAKIRKSMQRAVKSGTPFVSVIDSCGARVGEGAAIMEGYAELIAGGVELAGQVPHIVIIKGTAVGMMATYAAGADFVFMAQDAILSVNSPMYLASTTKSFPVDYKKLIGLKNYASSDVAQFGFQDAADLKDKMAKLFGTVLGAEEEESADDANRVDPALETTKSASERIASISDQGSVIEYCDAYASDVKCALAKINGISVGILATEGDYISEDGLEKAKDFVEKVDAYSLPLVTLVDTLGVNPDLNQEYRGFAKKAHALMAAIAASESPKIGVAVGNAVGYGYASLMSKGIGFDYTLATSKAVVSPIASVTAVGALMSDQLKNTKNADQMRAKLEEQYAAMQANPIVAAQDGYLDNVIEATNLRPYIASALLMLLGI